MHYGVHTLLSSSRWQFTIRTLLFVMLCIGGIIAGFQFGYRSGVEQRRADSQFAKVYSVADAIYVDAVSKEPDFDTLINALKSTVDPASWDSVGGSGSIRVMAQQPPMVIVAQSGKNHNAIAELLNELKTAREKNGR